MKNADNWYEVWADDSTDPPYLLIVRERDAKYVVLDPKEGGQLSFSSSSYDEVKMWLLEDEYVMVRGRMNFDA